jgi:NADH-ubiquinone oxidoreductase chain 6
MLYLLLNDNLQILTSFLSVLEVLFIISGLSIIITKNPILSVLFLINLFLLVSIYLVLIGIDFIGISYLLVYIGAVSILFLFILMLIDIRISELHTETMNNIVLGILLGVCLYIPINLIFVNINVSNGILYLYANFYSTYNVIIKHVTHNSWEGFIWENIDIISIGNILYTNLSIWLILSLLILLLAMVGAIVINLDIKSDN